MRLLFLHGFQQSPEIIQEETKFLESILRKALDEDVDLVYPSAPFPSVPTTNNEPTFTWWPESGSEEYQKTFRYLSDLLEEQGPFDGALGFSQGASVASLMAALLELPEECRPANFSTEHDRLNFVVSYSGYRESDPRVQQFYEPGIRTPVLHFINSTDPIMAEERCLRLVNSCVDTEERVITYTGSGNHRVPGTKSTKMALTRFLGDFRP